MKRYRQIVYAILFLMVFVAGCGNQIDYSLPSNAIEFNTGEFINPKDSEDVYTSIEYDNRTYIGYGTLKGRITNKDVENCLGYIVQDGDKMEDIRVFTLSSDANNNFLVQLSENGFMDPPVFLRAIDTVEKDIDTPSFIEDLGYAYWR